MIAKVSLSISSIFYYNDTIDTVLSLTSLLLLISVILIQNYSSKAFIIYLAIGIISLYSVSKSGNNGFLITIITCLAIRQEKIDDIIKFIYNWELLFFIVQEILSILFHLFFNFQISGIIDGVMRYSFGFKHPNEFSIYLFNLIIMWVWLNFKKINIRYLLTLSAIGLVSFYFTRTRTNFVEICIVILLLFSYCVSKEKSHRLINIMAKFSVPVLSVVIMGLVTQYTKNIHIIQVIDKLLSSRIRLGAYGYEHWGITFLGQNVSDKQIIWDPYWQLNAHTFDNIYSYLSVNQGIIWIVIISFLFYKLAKIKDVKINICLIAWALYGVTEIHGINGYKCFPIFLVSLLWQCNKNNISCEKGLNRKHEGTSSFS